MKKRFSVLLALVVSVSGLSMLAGATPASAHPQCAATGTVTITSPAGLGPAVVNDQNFTFTVSGSCAGTGGSVTGSGSGFGGCGASSGSATITYGGHAHNVTFQTAATTITISGDVRGEGNVAPDPAEPNNSCASNQGHKFLIEVVLLPSP